MRRWLLKRLRTWSEIVGVFAVVASLIFVGIQLRQDRELKKSELVFAMYGERQANLRSLVGENPAETYEKLLFSATPVVLTDMEMLILYSYVEMLYIDWQRSAWMEQFGIFGMEWRGGVGVYGVFSTLLGRRWLSERLGRHNNLPAEVQSELLRQLDGGEPVPPFKSMQDYWEYLRGSDYPHPNVD